MSDCIFCKIIAGEIPARKLYEDDEMVAFHDIKPVAPVHFMVVPKRHIKNLMEMEKSDAELVGKLFYKAQELAKEQGCEEGGGRFVTNAKIDGGQTVDHLHVHFLGGCKLGLPSGLRAK